MQRACVRHCGGGHAVTLLAHHTYRTEASACTKSRSRRSPKDQTSLTLSTSATGVDGRTTTGGGDAIQSSSTGDRCCSTYGPRSRLGNVGNMNSIRLRCSFRTPKSAWSTILCARKRSVECAGGLGVTPLAPSAAVPAPALRVVPPAWALPAPRSRNGVCAVWVRASSVRNTSDSTSLVVSRGGEACGDGRAPAVAGDR